MDLFDESKLLTVKQVAERLGAHANFVCREIRRGKLRAVKLTTNSFECGQPTDDSADLPLRGAGYRSENFALAEDFLARSYFDAPGCILLDLLNVGSAQIDVKISFKGRQPNKRAPQAALPLRFPGHGPAYEKERHYVTHSVDEVVSI